MITRHSELCGEPKKESHSRTKLSPFVDNDLVHLIITDTATHIKPTIHSLSGVISASKEDITQVKNN